MRSRGIYPAYGWGVETIVNSKDPKHRATIARQQAARRKKVKSGKLKTHFRTKSGKLVANPGVSAYDEDGRPIFRAQTNTRVVDFEGNSLVVPIRTAAEMMSERRIPIQEIRAIR